MVARSAYKMESEEEFLKMGFTMIDWAKALRHKFDITIIVGFWRDRIMTFDGIMIHFIRDGQSAIWKKFNLSFYRRIKTIIENKNIDILHIHNLGDPLTILALSRFANDKLRLIVQDHGSLPTWKHRLFSFCYRPASAFLFCSEGQEAKWITNGILTQDKCHFILENSSHFKYIDRQVARKATGLTGKPVLLWVGNLIPLKDPFTVLRAVNKLKENHPNLVLYMIYRRDDLLDQLKLVISQYNLEDQVKLLGVKQRTELENYYNSADIFISASHKEGSGYSAIEAMSCGCIPVLTNIPSFQTLSKSGTIGKLWSIQDADELVKQIEAVLNQPIEKQRQSVLEFFDKELSFDQICSDYLSLSNRLLN